MAFDPVIGSRFFFTAEDLDANRDGRLSAEQERLLGVTVDVQERHAHRATWMVAVVMGLAIVLTGIALAATPGGGPAAVAVAAVILAGVMGLVLWAMARGRRTREALRGRRLQLAEGTLRVRTTSTGHWRARVGAADFGVELDQAQALREDGRYRVHYLQLPDGAMPLSIEAVD